eukprot:7391569-Prymnesium_polylepis.2
MILIPKHRTSARSTRGKRPKKPTFKRQNSTQKCDVIIVGPSTVSGQPSSTSECMSASGSDHSSSSSSTGE